MSYVDKWIIGKINKDHVYHVLISTVAINNPTSTQRLVKCCYKNQHL